MEWKGLQILFYLSFRMRYANIRNSLSWWGGLEIAPNPPAKAGG